MIWHLRLGHASQGYLNELVKNQTELKNIKIDDTIKDCETCKLAKASKKPHPETRTRADKPLGRIHSDIIGPISPPSFPGGNRFITCFIDDKSRYARAYTIKTKDQVGDCLEKFIAKTRNLLGSNEKVCFIRADNALEYTGGKF